MKIKENIAVSENGFVFDPSTGDSYTLNTTGAAIVRLIHAGMNNEEIREHMVNTYDIDEPSFDRFLMDFVGVLMQYHLIEIHGA